ncbi:glycoside hydrolase superfamily [Mycena metata]|uniref:glucan endo-1,3-beta-D-glucosidase n=1 Tax=Mycena metata TaxID=1033252 RepID=A0AAD7IPN5_9AGAR|nr:glycoside hydrolase superfamily [Mycena metata]
MVFLPFLAVLAAFAVSTRASPLDQPTRTVTTDATSCFPALGFKMPSNTPSSLTNWWCDPSTEYGFIGFSYEVTACQSLTQLKKDFLQIRQNFNGRYIRLYGFCDNAGFYNNIVEAAWDAGVGVHALIWFGFDGGNEWMDRRNKLLGILHSNEKAKFVTRALQFGSEPLFDSVLDPSVLAAQVTAAKSNLSSLHIPVTISEMAYGYQENEDNGAQDVLDAIDLIDAHMLPFFSTEASTANKAWPIVLTDLDWFIDNGEGKKIYFTENGWPSVTSDGVQPNSPSAVANVQNEHDYYSLLDAHCEDFKQVKGGGVGWFWHIYSDDMEPGYGLYSTSGKLKFPFSPRTSC